MDNENHEEVKKAVDHPDGEQGQQNLDLSKADLISSVVIFAFGLYVLATGIRIAFLDASGTDVWYYSPGMYPILIGAVLMLLSLVMFLKKYREGARFGGMNIKQLIKGWKSGTISRLFLAIALLAVYVFLLIGRIPFVAATFLYLAVTMIAFRKDNFEIWKILLISAVATAAIYVFFGVLAAVPLP